MNIAVLMGGVGFDTQKRMINGILDSALPEGTNVYIFTCDGGIMLPGSNMKMENIIFIICRILQNTTV